MADYPFTLTLARSGSEAIDRFQNQKFDVILMDIQMPGMNGYETTKKIRELERVLGTYTPIIACTAYSMSEEVEKALYAGCVLVITKPIERVELLVTLKKILTGKEVNQS